MLRKNMGASTIQEDRGDEDKKSSRHLPYNIQRDRAAQNKRSYMVHYSEKDSIHDYSMYPCISPSFPSLVQSNRMSLSEYNVFIKNINYLLYFFIVLIFKYQVGSRIRIYPFFKFRIRFAPFCCMQIKVFGFNITKICRYFL